MSSSARGSTCCAPSWRSSPAEAPTPSRSCWRPPVGSSRSTSPSRARRTWTRSPRRCSAPGSTAASGYARSPRPPGPRGRAALTGCRARHRGPAAGRPGRAHRRLRRGRPALPEGGAAALRRRGVGQGTAALAVARLRHRPRDLGRRTCVLAVALQRRDRARRQGRSASSRSHSARARPCWCSAATSPPPRALVSETASVEQATGIRSAPYGALIVSAWRGRPHETTDLIETTEREAGARGEGIGLAISAYARAVLSNGLGRYEEALAAAASDRRAPRGRRGELGPERARRAGDALRQGRSGHGRAEPAGRQGTGDGNRLGARHRGACPGAAQRRR